MAKCRPSKSSVPLATGQWPLIDGDFYEKRISPLRCLELDCLYSGSFRSKWELRRHILSQHPSIPKDIKCPAVGCFKGLQPPQYSRSDKLTSHMRAMHPNPSMFNCPHPDCSQGPLDGLDMFVHAQSHIEVQDVEYGTSMRAVANAISPASPRCAIMHCGKPIPLPGLMDHLQEHGDEALRGDPRALDLVGLSYAQPADAHPIQGGVMADVTQWTTVSMRLLVVCPMCTTSWASHLEFTSHLVEVHLHRNSQHFKIWVAHVGEALACRGYTPLDQSHGSTISEILQAAIVWKPWRFVLMNSDDVSVDLRCPDCKIAESIRGNTMAVHQLSMLNRFEELFSRRHDILALYPQFATHPVFEDLHIPGQVSQPHVIRLQSTSNLRSDKGPSTPRRQGRRRSELSVIGNTDTRCHTVPSKRRMSDAISRDYSGISHHTSDRIQDPAVRGRGGCEDDKNAIAVSNPNAEDTKGMARITTTSATARQADCRSKPFSCENPGCILRFERRSDLRLHMRSHVRPDERPHKCDECSKRFIYPKDRRRHQMTHRKSCHSP